MNHKFLSYTDCEIYNCPICEGGLLVCIICGQVESELTESCPRRKLPDDISLHYDKGKLLNLFLR